MKDKMAVLALVVFLLTSCCSSFNNVSDIMEIGDRHQ